MHQSKIPVHQSKILAHQSKILAHRPGILAHRPGVPVHHPGRPVGGQLPGQPVPARHQVRWHQRADPRVASPPADQREQELHPLSQGRQLVKRISAGGPQAREQPGDLLERGQPRLVAEPGPGL